MIWFPFTFFKHGGYWVSLGKGNIWFEVWFGLKVIMLESV